MAQCLFPKLSYCYLLSDFVRFLAFEICRPQQLLPASEYQLGQCVIPVQVLTMLWVGEITVPCLVHLAAGTPKFPYQVGTKQFLNKGWNPLQGEHEHRCRTSCAAGFPRAGQCIRQHELKLTVPCLLHCAHSFHNKGDLRNRHPGEYGIQSV